MTMQDIRTTITTDAVKSKTAYATVFTGEYQIARINTVSITIIRDGERFNVYPEAVKSVRVG